MAEKCDKCGGETTKGRHHKMCRACVNCKECGWSNTHNMMFKDWRTPSGHSMGYGAESFSAEVGMCKTCGEHEESGYCDSCDSCYGICECDDCDCYTCKGAESFSADLKKLEKEMGCDLCGGDLIKIENSEGQLFYYCPNEESPNDEEEACNDGHGSAEGKWITPDGMYYNGVVESIDEPKSAHLRSPCSECDNWYVVSENYCVKCRGCGNCCECYTCETCDKKVDGYETSERECNSCSAIVCNNCIIYDDKEDTMLCNDCHKKSLSAESLENCPHSNKRLDNVDEQGRHTNWPYWICPDCDKDWEYDAFCPQCGKADCPKKNECGGPLAAESFGAEVCPCGCAMVGCVCSSSCKGECLGAESFGAEDDYEYWGYDAINRQIETGDIGDEMNHRVVARDVNSEDGENITYLHNQQKRMWNYYRTGKLDAEEFEAEGNPKKTTSTLYARFYVGHTDKKGELAGNGKFKSYDDALAKAKEVAKKEGHSRIVSTRGFALWTSDGQGLFQAGKTTAEAKKFYRAEDGSIDMNGYATEYMEAEDGFFEADGGEHHIPPGRPLKPTRPLDDRPTRRRPFKRPIRRPMNAHEDIEIQTDIQVEKAKQRHLARKERGIGFRKFLKRSKQRKEAEPGPHVLGEMNLLTIGGFLVGIVAGALLGKQK